MLLIPQHELLAWIGAVYWPFLRMTGVLLTAPVLGSNVLPVFFRILLSAVFAVCLAAWGGPWPPLPQGVFALMGEGTLQIVAGAGIGLTGMIIVSAIASGGEIAGAALGLNFATITGLNPDQTPAVLYNIFYWTGLLVYLGLGGMIMTIHAVSLSFHTFPAGPPSAPALHNLANFAGSIIETGVLIALPAIAASLALNAVTGLANALAPQINIFSIGFPLLFLGGIWIIATSLFSIEPIAVHLMTQAAKVLGVWTTSSASK